MGTIQNKKTVRFLEDFATYKKDDIVDGVDSMLARRLTNRGIVSENLTPKQKTAPKAKKPKATAAKNAEKPKVEKPTERGVTNKSVKK